MSGLSNGEFLARAAGTGFDLFITADRGLEYQQNLAGSRLGVLVLVAPSVTIEDLAQLVPRILEAMRSIGPGQVHRVSA